MPPLPEQLARIDIDKLLTAAGWQVFDLKDANIHATRGVAIREFPLNTGFGFADYLLYIDGKAAGVIEAKKQGATLTGVEVQSGKYAQGLPSSLPAWRRPLPFLYESTGVETHFTNGFDPSPRARNVFAFHQPDTLAEWLAHTHTTTVLSTGDGSVPPANAPDATFLARMQHMPPLPPRQLADLWPAQITAITNLEKSLAANKPRALIQMATGSGKTYTAISFIYRLIKFAGAKRILFLVDRGNLGRQTKKEFDQYESPYNNYKFGEEYIVQHLSSNKLDTTARVTICTIQRMYSMLKGRELAAEDDETSAEGAAQLFKEPDPIEYNPRVPIESFDIIITDEAHRSIYNLWRQVLEYFDAYLIGLTATPSKQTFGFFNKNLVMEYGHEQAVADGVNVNYDVYRIKTEVTEAGSKVEAGYSVGYRDRATRKTRWEQLDEDFEYEPNELDRAVQTPDQIRTVIRTFRDKLFTEIFAGRTDVPKTLFFAKDDNHAEKIVEILREEFGKGNEFAQKITYRTQGDPEALIKAFRNSYFPRVAVTVDMIATGTDIKPVEIVVFMRSVKSRNFFEQMKGRGVRVINPDDLRAVTPDAKAKDHFVIVDCVGVCERDMTDSRPMDQKKSVPFDKLLQAVALGNTEPDVLSSVAARLSRLDRDLDDAAKTRIINASGGYTLKDLSRRIVDALNPDREFELTTPASLPLTPAPAQAGAQVSSPVAPAPAQAGAQFDFSYNAIATAAVKPLFDPALRNLILELKKQNEQVIDEVTQDQLIEAGFSEAARERAKGIVTSFEQFIQDHKDEITALQILYNRPTKAPLRFEDLKALADAVHAPPRLWSESQLWQAYAALDKTKVKGASAKRILTDLVSLVRYAMHQENELVPYPERVHANFNAWMAQQNQAPQKIGSHPGEGRGPSSSSSASPRFTPEQTHWLEMIRDHIAANLGIEKEDFEYAPFAQQGGIGKVYQLFGNDLPKVLEELNRELAA
ncbi:MAG: DEAD/DEAH box helicase family protein [Rhodocyclaceae bacterium]|nr:DEAD/DEAH box helicase family protein [Rhodocyclaceae bacterium]MCA3026155.1 DEAD/DEAH box helicase family protein [Rhodocyclaceae bacterium]MCA3031570.1 DEAD/DEAH box helicase family protein [Rhodocyclaceae bacterium]MCA3047534.1 DEAD/DEAH box helicase family protein [Rhodocyclaceae bacterium]MCA3051117.1 DEAD/DEAH box helicase family protein [Rhodocyclaceae bacterium]